MATDETTLFGENIALREWTEADLPQMILVFDDPEIAYRTPVASPFDTAAAKAYLSGVRQARQAGIRLHLAITVDGIPQGEVMLNLATASIAYVVGASYRGQGLGRRALTRLVTHAYDVLGLQRTYLEIEADNVGSVRSHARPDSVPPMRNLSSLRTKGGAMPYTAGRIREHSRCSSTNAGATKSS